MRWRWCTWKTLRNYFSNWESYSSFAYKESKSQKLPIYIYLSHQNPCSVLVRSHDIFCLFQEVAFEFQLIFYKSIFPIQNSVYRSMVHVSQSQVKAVQWVKKGVCRDMARNGRKDNLVWDLTPTRLAPFSWTIPMSNVIFRVLLKSYSLLYRKLYSFRHFFLQFCICMYI